MRQASEELKAQAMGQAKNRPAERLPSKEGISPSCVALPPQNWPTLIDFLAHRFPAIEREEWRARMLRGEVLDAEGKPLSPGCAYRAYSKIYYYRSMPAEDPIPFEEYLVYQDDYLVVADKPHFLPVVPSGRYLRETLLVRMKRKLGIETLSPIHRIDRETAGLVLFSVQPESRNHYQSLFRQRVVGKCYEAIASLRPGIAFPLTYRSRLEEGPSFMQMREVPGEPNAETRIELQEAKDGIARFHLYPVTGQKHQLRAHMAALGMPILNDRIYPMLLPEEREPVETARLYQAPLQLLAKSLSFSDPVTGKAHCFESRFRLKWQGG
ncbi:pseudouridine synthase [Oxalobacteraceae bacterium R-40]|uniref:Pseudouridine synthase n=1 Tax=Keguizhuia sedimenti TaxID=3064264 RepID=A0ABU1BJJ8_9BURK|nr:pseudouridine synthase [Oxalobacteraceae bacterium R-40]